MVWSVTVAWVIVPAITGVFSRRAFSAPISLRPLPTVLLGLSAWLGYSAVAPLAEAHPSFWNLLWSEALSATTIESLATLVISLLPLRFLDGATLFAWKKWVWALAYFAALLILIFVIAPISDNWGQESAPLFGWGAFFILFALLAVGIWALFRLRSGGREERGQKSVE